MYICIFYKYIYIYVYICVYIYVSFCLSCDANVGPHFNDVPTSMMSMKSKAVLRSLQSGHATAPYRRGTCEV